VNFTVTLVVNCADGYKKEKSGWNTIVLGNFGLHFRSGIDLPGERGARSGKEFWSLQ
jgi:hypothetical protein